MRLPVFHLFIADDHFKYIFQTQVSYLASNAAIISTTYYAQPVTLLPETDDRFPRTLNQLGSLFIIMPDPKLVCHLPLLFRQAQCFIRGIPIRRIAFAIDVPIKSDSECC